MRSDRRPIVLAGFVLAVLALLGAVIAAGLSATLGIRTESKAVPVERLGVPKTRAVAPPPALTRIRAADDLRTRTAVAELRDAVGDAGRTRGTATLTVRAGHGDEDDDSYRLRGTASALQIIAASRTGAVRGIYDLAHEVRTGHRLDEHLGERVTSRLPFRMADLGAVGIRPDAKQWASGDDYSLNSGAFADAILSTAPYVDRAALGDVRRSAERYFEHILAEGYTAVAIPGFLEYIAFSEVGGGHAVYPAGDPHIARARKMRATFGAIWKRAHDLGLHVYLRTDMLALTTPLQDYLQRRFGGLATGTPAFWQVYQRGLDELYRTMPWVDGVIIRVGEAGAIYDLPGWDYYSDLAVTSVRSVREMLRAFTAEGERSDKDVIFRTWSVGIGAVGDMHTNPASYRKVLHGLDSDHLVVSTKYTLGDFYSYLPLNKTLATGNQRRIIEFQSRREFEAFGALPNDLGDLYRQALQRFLAANPRIEGVWVWTQDGGPLRAGPMTLELTSGFWQLYELNSVLAVQLARDPRLDPGELTADWIRRWFSTDPATVHAIGRLMALSRDAVRHGLYIEPYAEKRVFALGLEPPPMMWIFEWDILTGDSAALDVIYATSRDRLGEAITEGHRAVRLATRMRQLASGTDPASWRDPGLRRELLDALDYQVNLFRMLAAYRTMVLRHAEWLDTGSGRARQQWAGAEGAFDRAAARHEQRYDGDVFLPAYNLTAARIGEVRAARDLPMAWLARGGLVVVVGWLFAAVVLRRRVPAAAASLVAGTRPWRAAEAVRGLTRRDRVLLVTVPVLALVYSRLVLTWFAAPAHLAITGLGWVVLACGLAAVLRGRDPWPVIAAVGGAVVLRVLLLLAVLAGHGPGGYWFAFWTEPGRRSAYVVVAFMLFGWVLVAAGWALGGRLGGRRAGAAVVGTAGAVLLAGGILVGALGLEAALTAWNDQMALLPWGLSRILGITVYLGIPTALPWWVAAVGGVLLAGALVTGLSRSPRRTARGPCPGE